MIINIYNPIKNRLMVVIGKQFGQLVQDYINVILKLVNIVGFKHKITFLILQTLLLMVGLDLLLEDILAEGRNLF